MQQLQIGVLFLFSFSSFANEIAVIDPNVVSSGCGVPAGIKCEEKKHRGDGSKHRKVKRDAE